MKSESATINKQAHNMKKSVVLRKMQQKQVRFVILINNYVLTPRQNKQLQKIMMNGRQNMVKRSVDDRRQREQNKMSFQKIIETKYGVSEHSQNRLDFQKIIEANKGTQQQNRMDFDKIIEINYDVGESVYNQMDLKKALETNNDAIKPKKIDIEITLQKKNDLPQKDKMKFEQKLQKNVDTSKIPKQLFQQPIQNLPDQFNSQEENNVNQEWTTYFQPSTNSLETSQPSQQADYEDYHTITFKQNTEITANPLMDDLSKRGRVQLQQTQYRQKRKTCFINNKMYRNLLDIQQINEAKNFFSIYYAARKKGRISRDSSLRIFAQKLGLNYIIINTIYKQWIADPTLQKYEFLKDNQFLCKQKYRQTLTMKRCNFVLQLLQVNPYLQRQQLLEQIKANPQLVGSNGAEGINKALFQRMRIMLDLRRMKLHFISSRRNDRVDLVARRQYAKALLAYIREGVKIFYIDQMAINKYMNRNKIWGKQGQTFPNAMLSLKKQSSLLVVVRNHQGRLREQIVHGSIPKEQYRELVERLLSGYQENQKKLLIMHSAVGDQPKAAYIQVGTKLGFKVLQIPKYSSALNPLQFLFVLLRNRMNSQPIISDGALVEAARRTIQIIVKVEFMPQLGAFLQPTLQKCLLGNFL